MDHIKSADRSMKTEQKQKILILFLNLKKSGIFCSFLLSLLSTMALQQEVRILKNEIFIPHQKSAE